MSDSEDEGPDRELKLVILGDGASGKVRLWVSCFDDNRYKWPTSIESMFSFNILYE